MNQIQENIRLADIRLPDALGNGDNYAKAMYAQVRATIAIAESLEVIARIYERRNAPMQSLLDKQL